MVKEKIKVLIADDNKDFVAILQEYFTRQEDITVVGEAGNGLETLELISSEMPDIVLLDIIMPHLDGLGVLERIGEADYFDQRPKTIILTAFGQESMAQKLYNWEPIILFLNLLIWILWLIVSGNYLMV